MAGPTREHSKSGTLRTQASNSVMTVSWLALRLKGYILQVVIAKISATTEIEILVSEIGQRDGRQSIEHPMPTEAKHCWIVALTNAGLREIEVG
jgi:hypothetical protein